MTAVLEHGSQPAKQASVSSFLSPVNSMQENYFTDRAYLPRVSNSQGFRDCGNTQVQISGFDGADDRSFSDNFSRSGRTSRNMSGDDCTDHAEHTMSTIECTVNPGDLNQGSVIPDHQPQSGQRKRRKLTPGDGRIMTQPEIGGELDDSAGLYAVLGKMPVVKDGNTSEFTTKSGRAQRNAPTPAPNMLAKVPKRCAPVPGRLHTTNVVEASSRQPSDTENADLALNAEAASTSLEKKTMSLHTNGKLLSSPTSSPGVARTVPVKGKPYTLISKNFKVKSGKFVQSLEVVLRYGRQGTSRLEIGEKIDKLLSTANTSGDIQDVNLGGKSTTHPFFLGKIKPKLPLVEVAVSVDRTEGDIELNSHRQEPVAWKDIKFSNHKLAISKSVESIRPLWPPLSIQHVGKLLPSNKQDTMIHGQSNKAKLKTKVVQLVEGENLLSSYLRKLKSKATAPDRLEIPEMLHLSGQQVCQDLERNLPISLPQAVISTVRSKLVSGSTAFDRGECAGPLIWPLQYSPAGYSEVLQPSASILRDWLQNLAIHNVKSGIDSHGSTKKSKGPTKKKRRRLREGLDDFIVNSDDDDAEAGRSLATAILITGPNGCGKTASVFAVAKELGVEVFEIHPGMRRSAKDIFDKVGDMAHNHLVHKSSDPIRSSSVAPSDVGSHIGIEEDSMETSAIDFLGAKPTSKLRPTNCVGSNRPKKEQKQSLILFEEVDLLFDDDKGFWGGVQSLIQNSKRPVVLTCNDISAVPVHELDLHCVLTYDAIEKGLATEYLKYLAAAEGHVIATDALSSLYLSKRYDLRASITELNLWCQMTVGSKQGGLDWMVRIGNDGAKTGSDGVPLRTFSKGTYHRWLDMVPEVLVDNESAIRFAQDTLGILATDWCDFVGQQMMSDKTNSSIGTLSQLCEMTEAQSVIDLLDDQVRPVLASAATDLWHTSIPASNRDAIGARYLQNIPKDGFCKKDVIDALAPLMVEKPTFPPSQGRLAPSIDMATSSVATELAPYVRCIANFDKRLERQRDELFGSQGKARKTRAARAAAEGGDKASTRSERWFPKNLDFEKVLCTAGAWPEWHGSDDYGNWGEQSVASPSESPEAGLKDMTYG